MRAVLHKEAHPPVRGVRAAINAMTVLAGIHCAWFAVAMLDGLAGRMMGTLDQYNAAVGPIQLVGLFGGVVCVRRQHLPAETLVHWIRMFGAIDLLLTTGLAILSLQS